MPDLTVLRIYYRDEEIPELRLQMAGENDSFSLGHDREVELPNGEKIEVYAEVGIENEITHLVLSVIQNDRVFAVRCSSGAVISYETERNFEVLLQVGTGEWE